MELNFEEIRAIFTMADIFSDTTGLDTCDKSALNKIFNSLNVQEQRKLEKEFEGLIRIMED